MYAFPQLTIPAHGFAAAKARGCAPDALYALELVEHTGIVVVPGSGFRQAEGTHHIRITILPPPGELPGVLKRLTKFHAAFMKGTTHGVANDLALEALVASGAGAEGKSGQSKLMKMLTRTVIAFTLFAIFFGIMKAGHQWMIFAVLLIQVELFREFTNVRCVQRVSFALSPRLKTPNPTSHADFNPTYFKCYAADISCESC